jgi:hypothetical protein
MDGLITYLNTDLDLHSTDDPIANLAKPYVRLPRISDKWRSALREATNDRP